MKTSDKLILGLFLVTLVAILGANLVLKAEFEKIDFSDMFYKYSKESLPPFQVIHLQGQNNRLVQIQPSDNFEIRLSKGEENKMTWEVRGDTLFFSFKSAARPFYRNTFSVPPVAFIMAPSLRAIHFSEVSGKLTGWKENGLILQGNGKMLLQDNNLDELSVTIEGGGLLNISAENEIQKAKITVSDTSYLVVQKDIFKIIDINIDEEAHVSLPGGLFYRMTKE